MIATVEINISIQQRFVKNPYNWGSFDSCDYASKSRSLRKAANTFFRDLCWHVSFLQIHPPLNPDILRWGRSILSMEGGISPQILVLFKFCRSKNNCLQIH